jgi:oligosaccharide repeat unit polymerase
LIITTGFALLALHLGPTEVTAKVRSDNTLFVGPYHAMSPNSVGPERSTQLVSSRIGVSSANTRSELALDQSTAPDSRWQLSIGQAAHSKKAVYEVRTPRLPELVLFVAFLLTSVWSLISLPAPHPLQLWSVPWGIASFSFALGLLPFIEISWVTVGLILGSTATLGLGVAIGERIYSGHVRKSASEDVDELQAILRPAALVAIGLTVILLLAFLMQLTLRFGVLDTLVANSDVRLAIGEGQFPITVKYVYANLAAIALSGAMAGLASRARLSGPWIVTLLLLITTTYFSTARSNIFLGGVVAWVAFFVFRQHRPRWRSVAMAAVTAIAASVAVFVVLGGLVGKEFDAYPEFEQVPNAFQDNGTLSNVAIPYRYLSSSIPAFELQVQQSSLVGETYGCAMFSEACGALQAVGLNVEPVPRVKAFTAPYFEWNTYTSLDLPLIDFGKLLLAPIFGLIGVLVGLSWAAARRSRIIGGVTYSLLAGCLVGGYSTFFFTSPHIVGALLIALGSLGVASLRQSSVDGGKRNAIDPESPSKVST